MAPAVGRAALVATALFVVGVVVAVATLQLRASAAVLPDDDYIAIAKSTPQGHAYFRRFAAAPCFVTRGWDVTVNCDYPQPPPLQLYVEMFRVRIDPTNNTVLKVEIQTHAP